ncbi:E3 ubiquitin-protein ligase HECTD1 (E3 ligase for inhibin receptor) (EULIR) (HECT domain-containing protein 1) (HECT-type E3 ubiquitin transferase HECTD1), partial [Durusdinium trenchii]
DTALHNAAQQGHREIANMLLQKRASPDIPNDEGKTPLDNAREKGHEGIVGLLTAVPWQKSMAMSHSFSMPSRMAPAFLL